MKTQSEAFHDWAFNAWEAKYGVPPPWTKKEYVALASALKAFGSDEHARAAWSKYLNCSKDFYSGHSPSKFLLNLGEFVPRIPPRRKSLANQQGEDVRRAMIMRDVKNDPSIPEAEKQNEYARRVREL